MANTLQEPWGTTCRSWSIIKKYERLILRNDNDHSVPFRVKSFFGGGRLDNLPGSARGRILREYDRPLSREAWFVALHGKHETSGLPQL